MKTFYQLLASIVRKRVVRFALLSILAASLLVVYSQTRSVAAATEVTVKPSTLSDAGWGVFVETGTADGEFVNGPAAAPAGSGSARLTTSTGDGGVALIGGAEYAGTRLDEITTLVYSTYQAADSTSVAQAVTLQFNIDADLTDEDDSWQGRLVFEPYYSETVVKESWQTWDPMTQGRWWGSGAAIAAQCAIGSPCTWAEVLTNFPNAGIHGSLGAVVLKAGSGWPAGFDGNVDALTIGVNGDDTTYDFEPETVCTTTCYVDAINGDDSFGGDTPDSAKQTIQAGVNQVNAGGDVIVAPGVYTENVTINKALTLTGAGQADNPAVDTILDGDSLTGRGIFINTGITGVTIENLRIENFTNPSGSGIWANGQNHNFTVQNVTTNNNGTGSFSAAGGVYMNGPVDNVLIDNVTAHNNTSRGIVIWNGFKTNITITNNDVQFNNCCGIELQDGTASGVTMTGNTVMNNGDSGMSAVGLTSGAGPNLIANNTVDSNGRFGIEIKLPDGSGLDSGDGSIVIENNIVSLTSSPSDLRDYAGIAVFRRGYLSGNVNIPTGVIVRNNTASGFRQDEPGSDSTGFGIVVEGTNMVVEGNTLNDNDVGVQVQAGHLPYTPNASVDGDDGNLADDYFGRGNSPIACAAVSDNSYGGNDVNFRTVGTDSGSVRNLNSGAAFCGIQEAIDNANPGDTLYVANGTYAEALDVNKPLTINGESKTGVLIDASAINDYSIDVTADDVTLQNFTLLGNPGDTAAYGIKPYDVTNFTLQNVLVNNSHRTGVDLNGVNGALIQDVEVTNAPNGNGLAITDSNDITFENITTSSNAWGGLAIYTYGRFYPLGSDNVTIQGTNSFGEANKVYVQRGNFNDPDNPEPVTNLTVNGFAYTVMNDTHRAGGENFTYYQIDQDDAIAFALALPTPGDSYVNEIASGDFWVGQDNLASMTVQAAVDHAAAGDTIHVLPGTYSENVTLDKGVLLLGPNVGVHPENGARGDEAALSGIVALAAGVNDVTIAGFTIQDGAYGVRAVAGAQAHSNVTIQWNDFTNIEQSAVRHGLGFGGGPGSANWTISHNRISDITGADATAVVLFNTTGVTITGNTLRHTGNVPGRRGMNLDGVRDATVTGNEIDLGVTDFANQTAVFNAARYNVQLSMSDRSIDNVTLDGNSFSGAYDGIATLGNGELRNVTISNNEFANLVFGIRTQAGTLTPISAHTNVTIEGNLITNLVRDGIRFHGQNLEGPYTNVIVQRNHISGNGEFGVRAADGVIFGGSDAAFNATCNWWGAADGPSGAGPGAGDAVSSLIIFEPWLLDDDLSGTCDSSETPEAEFTLFLPLIQTAP